MISQQNQIVTDISNVKQKLPNKTKEIKINSPLEVLKETSRTFYIPIVKLPGECQNAVASAYLCFRAIDEIEDHQSLSTEEKIKLLRAASNQLQKIKANSTKEDLTPRIFDEYSARLPEVSLRLGEWIKYAPQNFQARIADTTSCMADRMAYWAEINWKIEDESDLDHYCFSVAGAVGLILCEIWDWFEGTKTDRDLAIGYGRGLQSVNILRNQGEDQNRGVSFLPPGWGNKELIAYCRRNLEMAKKYQDSLPKSSAALVFCKIPYALAKATLECIAFGKEKLSRQEVVQIIDDIDDEQSKLQKSQQDEQIQDLSIKERINDTIIQQQ